MIGYSNIIKVAIKGGRRRIAHNIR